LTMGFRCKEDGKLGNDAGPRYFYQQWYGNEWNNNTSFFKTENGFLEDIVIYDSEGGTGKSYQTINNKDLVAPLYVAHSKLLADSHSDDIATLGGHSNLVDSDQVNKIKNNYRNLLIDECSMMTNQMKKRIIKKYSNYCRIIFMGDFKYQLQAIKRKGETDFKIKNEYQVINLQKNYRFKDDKLVELLKQVRQKQDQGYTEKQLTEHFLPQLPKIGVTEVRKYHTNDTTIIVSKNSLKKKYNDALAKKYKNKEKKWRITKNSKNYTNGQIIKSIDKPVSKNCELAFCLTIHSYQGMTCEDTLFIDLNNLFDKGFFYTALSRVRRLDQIKIIMLDRKKYFN